MVEVEAEVGSTDSWDFWLLRLGPRLTRLRCWGWPSINQQQNQMDQILQLYRDYEDMLCYQKKNYIGINNPEYCGFLKVISILNSSIPKHPIELGRISLKVFLMPLVLGSMMTCKLETFFLITSNSLFIQAYKFRCSITSHTSFYFKNSSRNVAAWPYWSGAKRSIFSYEFMEGSRPRQFTS